MKINLNEFVLTSHRRLAVPIGVYAGLEMTGATVKDAVTKPEAQAAAVRALHERFRTPMMLTAMDLSAEAEAFGCAISVSDEEIPTVVGRAVSNADEIRGLPDPRPGDARTWVHLESARILASKAGRTPVIGGLIGPFSLAGRIFGVGEALELTVIEPETIVPLLEKVTRFLIEYAKAFRDTGASGILMAEPAAGLLSPGGLAEFSSVYVRKIVHEVRSDSFTVILHNCGARLVHLPAVLKAGTTFYHFGAPMDIPAVLAQVDKGIVMAGNLDPSSVFRYGTVDEVRTKTRQLLTDTADYPNYVISSGCDLPPGTPVANLEAFYEAVSEFNTRLRA
jgi:uroporphyrinogen decarboxylase